MGDSREGNSHSGGRRMSLKMSPTTYPLLSSRRKAPFARKEAIPIMMDRGNAKMSERMVVLMAIAIAWAISAAR